MDMNMMTKTRLALAAAALVASLDLAYAQPAPADHDAHHPPVQGAVPPAGMQPMGRGPGGKPGTMQPGAMMGNQGMMGGGMMAMMQMMRDGMMMPMGMGPNAMQPFAHLDGQFAYWRAELHLTDAQGPQWDAFAKAVRDNAGKLQPAMMTAMQTNGELTAPDQLDRRLAFLTAQVDAMRAVQAAAKPLYDALTADQKKVADGLMAEHMLGMRARGL
jgi:hypothetical protein